MKLLIHLAAVAFVVLIVVSAVPILTYSLASGGMRRK